MFPEIKPDGEIILLEAQFELFKHLVHKAGVATEELLLLNLASDSLEDDLLSLMELSRLIDSVGRDDYQATDEEERKLQGALNLLLAAYAGDPEIAERVCVVIAVEKSFGY